jgi:hypothetical protein
LAIVLSFLLRFTLSDYRFGNLKVFFVAANIPSLNTTFITLLQENVEDNKELISNEKLLIAKSQKS